ncbi:SWR1 complex subunit 6-like isoform X1 [Actinidia eriantha]|nr:SWR1 complex subunit 6-like isoform X1 [Actinidia eriantha]XP_057488077.1 SWR1 complex subunit 6-like isoform X1 [Actinidia eriantha]
MGSSYYLWCSCNLDLKGNFFHLAMDEDTSNPLRRMSSRTRKVASKMVAALASSDNRTQAALARLEALENDNAGMEMVEINSDDDASLDDEDQVYVKRQSKSTKRKTRQAKALENAKKAPRTFFELLHEANLESLPPHVPSYLRAAVGPPSSTSRRHFCTVCGFTAKYSCVRCGMRYCAIRCQNIHNDTRCLKFVA